MTQESLTLPPAKAERETLDTTKPNTAATLAIKRPPPEKPESIRARSLVVFTFWTVVVLLGLPVWLWTTSIHRAHLPLQEMLDWADGKACKLTFPLHILLEAPTLQHSEAQHLVRTTQHALDDLNEFSAHHLRLSLDDYADKVSALEVKGEEDGAEAGLRIHLSAKDNLGTPTANLRPHSTVLDVYYAPNQAPSISSSSSALASTIAAKLQEIFLEEKSGITYILASSPGSGYNQQSTTSSSYTPHNSPSSPNRDSKPTSILSPEISAKLARRRARSLKYAPTYHISISLFTPTDLPTSWDIDSAVAEYLQPLLDAFTISNFTIDTQVQHYAAFSPSMRQPEHEATTNTWTFRQEDLGSFINAAEWPLGPSIGSGPTLNFLLYVPSPDMRPLLIKDSGATSWLIPQWGGITILNPPPQIGSPTPAHLTHAMLEAPLQTFSHHLLSLLGLPCPPSLSSSSSSSSSFSSSSVQEVDYSFPLSLLTQTRIHTASLFFSSSSTLGALASLSASLPNIPIPETVADGVSQTIHHLRSTCDALKKGESAKALEHARLAEEESEKAFFERSMVGQVYFPEQHKVAVYLPLLGPIGVPLVTSLYKVIRGRAWRYWF
ncbi:MAG: hypothetical protein LQ340_001237 [Diploschistes diacapsis]|nr:MAG: hypothetical protein LQ340_001237 [Diploschistes diacapsis]